ncbi:type VI secretion system baseplate subunit TssK [Pseudoduganella umbonata]|uniref:Type VI secretion system baseplate subunit TssK n=1 Tax=Pseudoduganella umbonata TaxID=864828 RepID=A0A4P8HW86_9BURK|nr:type VI secretion system baseplate subunit TssK [Pseudoduganella umbonata]MBB3223021.1 type VI secretion system protein ImpJ [Pseudoduganella umbonata]QCP13128.1 type VI secretion system baseplate subunit TssK [Pseudoduganella umbonata]
MSIHSKVLWGEGLTFGPQQMQRVDLYHETRLQQLALTISPCLWGVRKAKWNQDMLGNNTLMADELSVLFQDGEIFDAPISDSTPAAVDLSTLDAEEQVFTFYAALPLLNEHGGNLEPSGRYIREDVEIADLFTSELSLDVEFLTKNLKLIPHTETRTSYISFPVIRIKRSPTGGFELDPTFIPPSVTLATAAGLPAMLDALLAKLNAKIAALYERHRMNGRQAFEVHTGDASSFWMLNVICTAAAPLTHCARYRQHHPEYVFDKLTALAGGLMTFSPKYALADLPPYQHDDPGPGFYRLDQMIRDLIDTVISSRYFTVPLVCDPARTTIHQGVLDPARVERRTELCLAVSADMPALELVAAVPLRFKIGSPDDVERMISVSLPGVELVHMAQVPGEVPVRPNTYYFSLTAKGNLYENMLKAQTIAIYAPSGMKGLRIELFGIAP